jgi:hypothetical protein
MNRLKHSIRLLLIGQFPYVVFTWIIGNPISTSGVIIILSTGISFYILSEKKKI